MTVGKAAVGKPVAVVVMVVGLLVAGCADYRKLTPAQQAWFAVSQAQQYSYDVAYTAGMAHAQGIIDDGQLAQVRQLAGALDTAWREVARVLVAGGPVDGAMGRLLGAQEALRVAAVGLGLKVGRTP